MSMSCRKPPQPRLIEAGFAAVITETPAKCRGFCLGRAA
jgi:hypothetical protein